jgi:hypothetical protein
MPGMPGMPGGFGGADYDLDKVGVLIESLGYPALPEWQMMASMGGPGDDHAGEHDTPVALDDPESDDSDDAEPPPLESPASAA